MFFLHKPHFIKEIKSWEEDSQYEYTCGSCNRDVSGKVLALYRSQKGFNLWLQCPSCESGSIKNSNDPIIPLSKKNIEIDGLPNEVKQILEEAGDSLSFESYTGCEMLCRKILMYVAVDKGAKHNDSFINYVDYLVGNEYVTKNMRNWIEFIRDSGNHANHEILSIDKSHAESVFEFTCKLLEIVYDMESKVNKYSKIDRKST